MIYIFTDSTDPAYNLALEEYVFTRFPKDEEYLLLWQNDRSVIIGKHQNAPEEVNLAAADRLGIPVIRRMSGGGSVYHDLGNLNYSFIMSGDGEGDVRAHLAGYLVKTCEMLGIKAGLTGRNDVTAGGKKISGTAGYSDRNRSLTHGTILLKADRETMEKVLMFSPDKYRSKGVSSVSARVTDLSGETGREITSEEAGKNFLKAVFDRSLKAETGVCPQVCEGAPDGAEYRLSDILYIPGKLRYEAEEKGNFIPAEPSGRVLEIPEELLRKWVPGELSGRRCYMAPPKLVREILDLKKSKYDTWEWNMGYFPSYERTVRRRIEGCGTLEISMDVAAGSIARIFIGGDYLLGIKPVDELCDLLAGLQLKAENVMVFLSEIHLRDYIQGINNRDFAEILLGFY